MNWQKACIGTQITCIINVDYRILIFIAISAIALNVITEIENPAILHTQLRQ